MAISSVPRLSIRSRCRPASLPSPAATSSTSARPSWWTSVSPLAWVAERYAPRRLHVAAADCIRPGRLALRAGSLSVEGMLNKLEEEFPDAERQELAGGQPTHHARLSASACPGPRSLAPAHSRPSGPATACRRDPPHRRCGRQRWRRRTAHSERSASSCATSSSRTPPRCAGSGPASYCRSGPRCPRMHSPYAQPACTARMHIPHA